MPECEYIKIANTTETQLKGEIRTPEQYTLLIAFSKLTALYKIEHTAHNLRNLKFTVYFSVRLLNAQVAEVHTSGIT